MRTWSHAAILACLSIKWLTLVVAETIYCDDPELCADNQDGSLLDLEHDSGADEFKDRSTRGDPFLRFGRNEPYLRFGRGDPFLRFGRGDPFLRFGRGDPFLRFGRGDPFLRFGRGDPFLRFGRGDPFLRFGRGDPFLRFGRGDPFLRFGRGDPFLRFGRGDPFLRFGRDNSMARVARGDPFLRFGRFKPSVDTDDSSIDIDDEDITRRSNDDKSNRKKREANAPQTDNMAKRMFQGSAAETKDRSSEKRDKYESRETRGNPYMRFGRNNMADYSLSDDTKDTMLDEDFSRISRDPSRIAYPRYGKRSDKGKVYMRFGRTPGSDYMATDSASQKR